MQLRMKSLIVITLAVIFAISTSLAFAQDKPKDYPKRTIEIVVPVGPGGGSDSFVRTICIRARRILKTPIAVVNRPGAGGILAMEYIQSQPADGYTLWGGTLSPIIYGALIGLTKIRIDDWSPILRGVYDTAGLNVLYEGKYKNVQDLIADAKARPGKQNWGVMGNVTGLQAMYAKEWIDKAGIDIKLVPYNKAGKMVASFLGGHLDAMLEEPGSISDLIKTKKIRPVLIYAKDRIPAFPDVPTTKELGVPAYRSLARGLLAKKGTPEPIINYLHAAFKKSYSHKLFQNYLKAEYLDLRPGYLNPTDMKKFLKDEEAYLTEKYKKAGIYKLKK